MPGFSFQLHGTGDHDALVITTDLPRARLAVQMPAHLVPWRDLGTIEAKGRRPRAGCDDGEDLLARMNVVLQKREKVVDRTGFTGVDRLELAGGVATLEGGDGRMVVSCLRVARGTSVTVAVRVAGGAGGERKKPAVIDVLQLGAGRRLGGVRLVLGGK